MNFSELGLSPETLKAIDELGYSQPTPIQAQAIPVALSGSDLMAAAQTGTGKTAAFILPLIERLKGFANRSASPAMHPVRALILTPTRELADQIGENAKAYTKYCPLRVTTVFGGVSIEPQMQELRRGVEIVIATPGRLLDHLSQKSVHLNKIDVLVLDEADRMLDMGFINDIRKILSLLPSTRQTMLFSATFSPEIRKLSADFMKNPKTVEVARRNATNDMVEQIFYKVEPRFKKSALAHLINNKNMSQVIVFCRTKITSDHVARYLKKEGFKAEAIHGDKTQAVRLDVLSQFKAGDLHVLVATDVAARGLDISELPYVVNFDLPTSPEDYVHRIGRTGRAGIKGVAISLMTEDEDRAFDAILSLTKQSIEPQNLPSTLFVKERSVAPRVPMLGAGKEFGAEYEQPDSPIVPGRKSRFSRGKKEIPALLMPPRYKVGA